MKKIPATQRCVASYVRLERAPLQQPKFWNLETPAGSCAVHASLGGILSEKNVAISMALLRKWIPSGWGFNPIKPCSKSVKWVQNLAHGPIVFFWGLHFFSFKEIVEMEPPGKIVHEILWHVCHMCNTGSSRSIALVPGSELNIIWWILLFLCRSNIWIFPILNEHRTSRGGS